MSKSHTTRRKRALPNISTIAPARLVMVPNLLTAEGEPRPALATGGAIVVFATIPAALAALRMMEAGR